MTAPPPGRPAIATGDAAAIPLLQQGVGDRLRDSAGRFGDADAVLWEEGDGLGRLGFRALLARSERAAALLLRHAAPGDRVAVWARNSLDWIVLEYACALAGAVVVAWNTAWTDAECGHALALAPPRLLFAGCDARGVELLERARRLGGGATAWQPRVFALDQLEHLAREVSSPPAWPAVAPGDPFLLQFTSGTTGRAKAAALSHRAALNAAWVRARLYDAGPGEVWLNPVPMAHVGGAVVMLLGAMATGGAYVLMPRFETGAFVRMMQRTGATRIGGVPTMLFNALDHPDWRPIRTVRSIGLGGAPVPKVLVRRLHEQFDGAPVMVTYGQSECPLATSTLAADPPDLALHSAGRVVPHVELRIRGAEHGEPRAVGEVGEIQLRTPMMMSHYHAAPEATAAAFTADGFLRTGDLGLLDQRGVLRMRGRAREVIIRGGENIYPAEVEDALLRHPEVAQAAAIGVADRRWGQQVGAVVVPRPGAAPDPAELERWAASLLSHFKVPRRWRVVQAMPMTASGKIRKAELGALFEPDAP